MVTETKVNQKRARSLNQSNQAAGPVVYWMSRDQRAMDNWALLFAMEIARQTNQPLEVVFCLTDNFPSATNRHYHFMLEGLKVTEKELCDLGINFKLLVGEVEKEVSEYVGKINGGVLVTDFSPLKIGRLWRQKVSESINVAMYEVDSHNIVPAWISSNKKEWAAYTLRPKINALLGEFLTDFPKIEGFGKPLQPSTDWSKAIKEDTQSSLQFKPGSLNALNMLDKFLSTGIKNYADQRNDPSIDGQSNLSPYLHFGQISSQRIAIETKRLKQDANTEAFLEELIIRKELADNFCFYDENYDNPNCFPDWATRSLKAHLSDKREFLYSVDEFEHAKTHDEAWNAAQNQMVKEGKMHGYMRMYWAKKILEWTDSPESAMKIAIYLNDKYQLDGRDPNGYAGIAWSIGGVHDRPWFEREIFGQIRYMNRNGLEKKFDLDKYISKYSS